MTNVSHKVVKSNNIGIRVLNNSQEITPKYGEKLNIYVYNIGMSIEKLA